MRRPDCRANEATTRFGLITTIGMAIVAVSAPILGAYGDHTASRKRLLVACAAVGIASTFALTTITEGGWQWAALLFVVGNIGVSGSLVFYDSMLPSVASPDETDRVSSAGYALGYLGGGLLLVLNLAWVLQPQMFGLPGTVAAIKLSFASVGVWWLLFMIPLLRRVPEPPRIAAGVDPARGSALRGAFARLAHTFVEIRAYPQAFLALLAMLVYQDGIQTIIRFAGIYGAEVGVGQSAADRRLRDGPAARRALRVRLRRARRAAWAPSGPSSWRWRCTRWPPRSATSCRTPRTSSCWPGWSPRCRAARRRSADRSSRG